MRPFFVPRRRVDVCHDRDANCAPIGKRQGVAAPLAEYPRAVMTGVAVLEPVAAPLAVQPQVGKAAGVGGTAGSPPAARPPAGLGLTLLARALG